MRWRARSYRGAVSELRVLTIDSGLTPHYPCIFMYMIDPGRGVGGKGGKGTLHTLY